MTDTNMFTRLKYLKLVACLSGIALALLVVAPPVFAAEDELQLLTIEGNLLGELDSLRDIDDPFAIINAYYELLPAAQQTEIRALHDQYRTLIPDYQVALFAADSAEVTEVKENITHLWATIRAVHEQLFKMEVVELLDQAYSNLLVVGVWQTTP